MKRSFLVLLLCVASLACAKDPIEQPAPGAPLAWSAMATPPSTGDIYSVRGSSRTNVFAVGSSGGFYQLDGGAWKKITTGSNRIFWDVWVAPNGEAFIVGEDGGQRYDGILNPFPDPSGKIKCITGTDLDNIYVTGSDGDTYRYHGGVWRFIEVGAGRMLNACDAAGGQVFLGGNQGSLFHVNGTVWSAIRGGQTFALPPAGVSGVGSVPPSIAGDTLVDGRSGSLQERVILKFDLTRFERPIGYVSLDLAVESVNCCDSVKVASFGATGERIFNGDFFEIGNRIATFDVPFVTLSTHLDITTAANNVSTNYLGLVVYTTSATTQYRIGKSSHVPLPTPTLTAWKTPVSDPPPDYYGVWAASASAAFMVGKGGAIRHVNGTTWSDMTSGTTLDLNDVWGASTTDVFAVGAGGIILHYDGKEWSEQYSGTSENLRGVWGTSGGNVYAVGDNATILHYAETK